MPKKHIKKPRPMPPDTERYCLSCQKTTTWHYNRMYGHSRCTECGGAFCTEKEVPEEILATVAKRIMPWTTIEQF